MENLNALVRPALAAWPVLQEVLEAKVEDQSGSEPVPAYPWTAAHGFDQPLSGDQVCALTRQLMLQVCSLFFVSVVFSGSGILCAIRF